MKRKNKLLSVILTFAMMLSLLPTVAFATITPSTSIGDAYIDALGVLHTEGATGDLYLVTSANKSVAEALSTKKAVADEVYSETNPTGKLKSVADEDSIDMSTYYGGIVIRYTLDAGTMDTTPVTGINELAINSLYQKLDTTVDHSATTDGTVSVAITASGTTVKYYYADLTADSVDPESEAGTQAILEDYLASAYGSETWVTRSGFTEFTPGTTALTAEHRYLVMALEANAGAYSLLAWGVSPELTAKSDLSLADVTIVDVEKTTGDVPVAYATAALAFQNKGSSSSDASFFEIAKKETVTLTALTGVAVNFTTPANVQAVYHAVATSGTISGSAWEDSGFSASGDPQVTIDSYKSAALDLSGDNVLFVKAVDNDDNEAYFCFNASKATNDDTLIASASDTVQFDSNTAVKHALTSNNASTDYGVPSEVEIEAAQVVADPTAVKVTLHIADTVTAAWYWNDSAWAEITDADLSIDGASGSHTATIWDFDLANDTLKIKLQTGDPDVEPSTAVYTYYEFDVTVAGNNVENVLTKIELGSDTHTLTGEELFASTDIENPTEITVNLSKANTSPITAVVVDLFEGIGGKNDNGVKTDSTTKVTGFLTSATVPTDTEYDSSSSNIGNNAVIKANGEPGTGTPVDLHENPLYIRLKTEAGVEVFYKVTVTKTPKNDVSTAETIKHGDVTGVIAASPSELVAAVNGYVVDVADTAANNTTVTVDPTDKNVKAVAGGSDGERFDTAFDKQTDGTWTKAIDTSSVVYIQITAEDGTAKTVYKLNIGADQTAALDDATETYVFLKGQSLAANDKTMIVTVGNGYTLKDTVDFGADEAAQQTAAKAAIVLTGLPTGVDYKVSTVSNTGKATITFTGTGATAASQAAVSLTLKQAAFKTNVPTGDLTVDTAGITFVVDEVSLTAPERTLKAEAVISATPVELALAATTLKFAQTNGSTDSTIKSASIDTNSLKNVIDSTPTITTVADDTNAAKITVTGTVKAAATAEAGELSTVKITLAADSFVADTDQTIVGVPAGGLVLESGEFSIVTAAQATAGTTVSDIILVDGVSNTPKATVTLPEGTSFATGATSQSAFTLVGTLGVDEDGDTDPYFASNNSASATLDKSNKATVTFAAVDLGTNADGAYTDSGTLTIKDSALSLGEAATVTGVNIKVAKVDVTRTGGNVLSFKEADGTGTNKTFKVTATATNLRFIEVDATNNTEVTAFKGYFTTVAPSGATLQSVERKSDTEVELTFTVGDTPAAMTDLTFSIAKAAFQEADLMAANTVPAGKRATIKVGIASVDTESGQTIDLPLTSDLQDDTKLITVKLNSNSGTTFLSTLDNLTEGIDTYFTISSEVEPDLTIRKVTLDDAGKTAKLILGGATVTATRAEVTVTVKKAAFTDAAQMINSETSFTNTSANTPVVAVGAKAFAKVRLSGDEVASGATNGTLKFQIHDAVGSNGKPVNGSVYVTLLGNSDETVFTRAQISFNNGLSAETDIATQTLITEAGTYTVTAIVEAVSGVALTADNAEFYIGTNTDAGNKVDAAEFQITVKQSATVATVAAAGTLSVVGGEIKEQNAQTGAYGGIKVKVTDAASNPMEDITVTVAKEAGASTSWVLDLPETEFKTDANGEVLITGLKVRNLGTASIADQKLTFSAGGQTVDSQAFIIPADSSEAKASIAKTAFTTDANASNPITITVSGIKDAFGESVTEGTYEYVILSDKANDAQVYDGNSNDTNRYGAATTPTAAYIKSTFGLNSENIVKYGEIELDANGEGTIDLTGAELWTAETKAITVKLRGVVTMKYDVDGTETASDGATPFSLTISAGMPAEKLAVADTTASSITQAPTLAASLENLTALTGSDATVTLMDQYGNKVSTGYDVVMSKTGEGWVLIDTGSTAADPTYANLTKSSGSNGVYTFTASQISAQITGGKTTTGTFVFTVNTTGTTDGILTFETDPVQVLYGASDQSSVTLKNATSQFTSGEDIVITIDPGVNADNQPLTAANIPDGLTAQVKIATATDLTTNMVQLNGKVTADAEGNIILTVPYENQESTFPTAADDYYLAATEVAGIKEINHEGSTYVTFTVKAGTTPATLVLTGVPTGSKLSGASLADTITAQVADLGGNALSTVNSPYAVTASIEGVYRLAKGEYTKIEDQTFVELLDADSTTTGLTANAQADNSATATFAGLKLVNKSDEILYVRLQFATEGLETAVGPVDGSEAAYIKLEKSRATMDAEISGEANEDNTGYTLVLTSATDHAGTELASEQVVVLTLTPEEGDVETVEVTATIGDSTGAEIDLTGIPAGTYAVTAAIDGKTTPVELGEITVNAVGPEVDTDAKTITMGDNVLTVGEYGTYVTSVALDEEQGILTITSNDITLTMTASEYTEDGSNTFTITSDETAVIVVDGVAQAVEGTDTKTVEVAADGTIIIALKGDFTGDGKVDSTDANQILIADSNDLDGVAKINQVVGNVAGESKLDSTDANWILQYDSELVSISW